MANRTSKYLIKIHQLTLTRSNQQKKNRKKRKESNSALSQIKCEQPVIDIRDIRWVWTYDNRGSNWRKRKCINKTDKKVVPVQSDDFMSCSVWKYKIYGCDWVGGWSITEMNRPQGSCALTWSISTPAHSKTRKYLCLKQVRQLYSTFQNLSVPTLSQDVFRVLCTQRFWTPSNYRAHSPMFYITQRMHEQSSLKFHNPYSSYSFSKLIWLQLLGSCETRQPPAACVKMWEMFVVRCSIAESGSEWIFTAWLNSNQLTHRRTQTGVRTHTEKIKK